MSKGGGGGGGDRMMCMNKCLDQIPSNNAIPLTKKSTLKSLKKKINKIEQQNINKE